MTVGMAAMTVAVITIVGTMVPIATTAIMTATMIDATTDNPGITASV